MERQATLDGLLNRRVALEQPKDGFRVAVDTVMLAAAVPARVGDRVLDMGAGVGGGLLCLACRVPGLTGLGAEIQEDLAALFRRNIARNAFASGLDAWQGDVTRLPPDFNGAFDLAMANPPFHDVGRHDVSPERTKRVANADEEGDLVAWITAAAQALKTGGAFTMIHRADREDEILSALRGDFGAVEILRLLPRLDGVAKRMIVRARKGAAWDVRECVPLVMHRAEGGFTPEADAVLRDAQALVFQSP